MCKMLQSAVAEKFPKSIEAVVGGYFFLRFICPALVSPDIYGVLPGAYDRRRARKTNR